MLNKVRCALVSLVLVTTHGVVGAQDPGNSSNEATAVVSQAEIEMIGARGAVQVSQIADQAQLKLSLILIRQNDELIRLLREMVKKPK